MWATVIRFPVWLLIGVMVGSCATGPNGNCKGGTPCIPDDEPHSRLSDYRFYRGELSLLNPSGNLLPYDLNTQLFSDYAQKLRLVYVPEHSVTEYKQDGVFDFPVGSVLVKNFFYDRDLRNPAAGRTILETRILMHQNEGWTAETYVWNEEQNEARLKQTGDSKNISWIDGEGNRRTVNYLIPTKNDCKTCHSKNGRLVPLGPEALNLNKPYMYTDGEENQLVKWRTAGLLRGNFDPESISKMPVWDDSSTGTPEQRARAYLHVNCSNCHNPAGSASNTALFLEYREENALNLGICKMPISAGSGSGGLKYNIVPGEPEQSILVYRMASTKPAVRMPEIGRTMVHDEAVELIREWIKSLPSSTCN